jgi:glucose-6-phosphate isomerase
MESNGKRVDLGGQPLPFGTSPVVWGEPGTNGQHAYFQMLHQGTDVVPVEFIAVAQGRTRCRATTPAAGQRAGAGAGADAGQGRTPAATGTFPGNRPSTFCCWMNSRPTSLGALIALQEHRVFVSGSFVGHQQL